MKEKETPGDLHPNNLHRGRYDLIGLVETVPELKEVIFVNEHGTLTLDFSKPRSVKLLNKALLLHHYGYSHWDIPEGFLCPPIPGRADYLHYLSDLLAQSNGGKIPKGPKVRVLDVGTGANLIYPMLGISLFEWSFVGSEIYVPALAAAAKLVEANPSLTGKVTLRHQADPSVIFQSVLLRGEVVDLVCCNPPFHESAAAAQAGSQRKERNLRGTRNAAPVLNFGGQAAELWTDGGERGFVSRMILESARFSEQVCWFSVLVSKSENLQFLQGQLDRVGVREQRVIDMAQGNKKSRLLVWTFLTERQRAAWRTYRWG